MIAIPNMERPESCWQCYNEGCDHWAEHGYDNSAVCPLIDIVTCGECKWYNPWHANHTNLDGNHCRYIDRPMKPTDFCSYGERRSE